MFAENPPTDQMIQLMLKDGQLQKRNQGDFKVILHSLTDKGRRDLHEG
mgnify:CR=1 FL=1